MFIGDSGRKQGAQQSAYIRKCRLKCKRIKKCSKNEIVKINSLQLFSVNFNLLSIIVHTVNILQCTSDVSLHQCVDFNDI